MTPPEHILHKLRTEHVGRGRAITRHDLRDYLRQMGHDISDRELRTTYSRLDCLTGPTGIWWPNQNDGADIQAFYERERNRGKAIISRAARVRRAHAGLFEDRQMDLPI